MNKSFFLFLLFVGLLACNDNSGQSDANPATPPGNEGPESQTGSLPYDLDSPGKFNLPDVLNEVSGIGFHNGNSDTLFAQQDEEGRLFYLSLGDKKAHSIKFGKSGDYEDLAIIGEQVILLRSDGTLFSFPYAEIGKKETALTKKWEHLLPKGEFEGMFADATDNKIYVLCKDCSDDKPSESVSICVLQLRPDGTITKSDKALIDVKSIAGLAGEKNLKFHPSALAKHYRTGEWHILSSVNRMLVVTDSVWKIREVHALDPSHFRQPEGIAFDRENNLYISNEGDKISKSNVLKFIFRK